MNTTSTAPRRVSLTLVTEREAADALTVTDRTVRRLAADGRLRAFKIGRVTRYALEDIEGFLLDNARGGPAMTA